MTARSRERGSHAGQPRGSFPFFGLPGLATLTSGRLGGRLPVQAGRDTPPPPEALATSEAVATPEAVTTPGAAAMPVLPDAALPEVPSGLTASPASEAPPSFAASPALDASPVPAAPSAREVPPAWGASPPHEVPSAQQASPVPQAPPVPGFPGAPEAAPLPLPDAASVPQQASQAPDSASAPLPAAPRPPAPPPGRGHRHRKQPERRPLVSGKVRLAAAGLLFLGVLGVGFATGFGGEPSAEPAVQSFLLDWQSGNYAQAAALTDGTASQVTAQLAAAYTDLDATNAFFALDHIEQHGKTAVATFKSTVDLAQGGQHWTYTGKFGLTAKNGGWVVDWSPAVINPRLGAGDRLAVVTTYAPRAAVEDVDGKPLLAESDAYRIGVYPGQLKNPVTAAAAFSKLTGLDELQVLGQIKAAPPRAFLALLTLDPAGYGKLWPKLAKVPGLSYQQQKQRLFDSAAQDVVGQVGTENSQQLRAEGAAYQPGMTVGLNGLEQSYQDELIGTPTTSVIVVDKTGRTATMLWSSTGGHGGTPVQTTLDSRVQGAADGALAGQSSSAEIVAVDTRTGAVRALASREAGGGALPSGGALNARVEPGMAFSIVSAAALLSTGIDVNHPLPCEPVTEVGGETFTYQPSGSATATLAADFADGCGTAFANLSRTLTTQRLTSTERAFGIGAAWQLRLPAFSGSAAAVSTEADVAEQATGTKGVLMSPLSMAAVAAEVADGSGHTPVLMPAQTSASLKSPLTAAQLTGLRQLMRLAVQSGSAHAANLSGTPVFGQAGVVRSGKNSYLSWFVGYRGNLAVAVLETGTTAGQAAAALAGHFLSAAG